jgi:hypothetical protein
VTVVVAFYCTDGVVVAADSMLTTSIGNISLGHHTGIKCALIAGPQILAFSGDPGLAARFRAHAEATLPQGPGAAQTALQHTVNLCANVLNEFNRTGIAPNQVNLQTVLAFEHGGAIHCCAYQGPLQPRLLDANHFYITMGSGSLSADPFVRFVSDTFCAAGPPGVHLATFLAVWVVKHVIDVNPGGVADPIRVAVFEKNANAAGYTARELPATEIAAHVAAIDDAAEALRSWRNNIQSGAAAGGVAAPPIAPAAAAGTAPIVIQTIAPAPPGAPATGAPAPP